MTSPKTKQRPRLAGRFAIAAEAILLVVVLAGMLARIGGVPLHVADSGDEWGNTMAPLRLLYEHGDPNVFLHPALYYYVTAAAYTVVYWASKLLGVAASTSMTDLFVGDQRFLVFTARGVSVASAALALVMTYTLAASLWRRREGMVAAALLAVLPLHVFYSKTARVDGLFLFVFLWAFLRIVRLLDRPTARTYATAGLLTGLAIGANYNGGILIAWLIAAHFLRDGEAGRDAGGRDAPKRTARHLVGALALTALGFVVSNPFTLLNFPTFYRNFTHQSSWLLATHPGWEERNVLYYVEHLWRANPAVVVLMGVSAVAVAAFGRRTERFVLSLPVVYFLFFSLMHTRDERFLLPAMALFLVVASGLPFVLVRRFAAWGILRIASAAAAYALLLLCIGTSAAESFRLPQPRPYEVLAQPDQLLLDWIEEHAPPRSAILVESGVVPLVDTLKEPGRLAAELRASLTARRPNLDQRFVGAVYVGGRNYDPGVVVRKQIDYAIVSWRNVQYIQRRCDAYPEVCSFYAELAERGRLVFETPPGYEPAFVYEVD